MAIKHSYFTHTKRTLFLRILWSGICVLQTARVLTVVWHLCYQHKDTDRQQVYLLWSGICVLQIDVYLLFS